MNEYDKWDETWEELTEELIKAGLIKG